MKIKYRRNRQLGAGHDSELEFKLSQFFMKLASQSLLGVGVK